MELYYAIFTKDDDGISVAFPDLDGAFTSGDDMHEALYMAKDLLAGWLINAQEDKEEFPIPSEPEDFNVTDGELVVPIEVNLDLYRSKFEGKYVSKNLRIPEYLKLAGEKENINFSQLMSEALKDRLNI